MTTGLLILSGAVPGIRDLSWQSDPVAVLGYMPYRSETRYGPWTALAVAPVPGERFRDQTTLTDITTPYTVMAADWTEQGTYEYWSFRIPNAPIYGEVVDGRVLLASIPEHIQLTVDGAPVMAARVDGMDGTVWLPRCNMNQGGDPVARPYGTLTSSSVVTVVYKQLTNFVEPTPEKRSFYTVVPVLADGHNAYAPGTQGDIINTLEVDRMDYMQAEMVRRNAWGFELVGEPARLLIQRTKGVRCGCVMADQPRTGCQSCYETGIIGGYYGPIDMFFIDPDQGTTTEILEGGKKVPRQSRSYLGPIPLVQAGDLIIRKNGERLVIGTPTYKSPRGVLLQQDFDVSLLPSGDTRYRIPLRASSIVPTIFNPAFQDSPGSQGEPVTTPDTDPTKTWENPVVPVGRTVVFGNTQT